MRHSKLLATIGAVALIPAVQAQSAAPANPMAGMTRFAGTIEDVSADGFTVKTADAGIMALRLLPSSRIMRRNPASVSDIQQSSFIGCTAVAQAEGTLLASECHLFPDSMRGMGEGHNPMGPPATTMTNGLVTTMTNGNVQGTSGTAAGPVLTLSYPGGSQVIHVTSRTELTQIVAADASALRPGTRVNGGARLGTDGKADAVMLNIITASGASAAPGSPTNTTAVEMPGKEFRDGHIQVGGFRLHYREAGPPNAPVIISLPGSAGLEMSRAKDQLIRDYRVIEINPPGWGDDPELKREMNQDEIGRLLGEAANQLVKTDYFLIGTSMGGANALWLTRQFPKRVKGIVLEGSMAPTRHADLYSPMIYRENVRKMLANPPAGGASYPTLPPDPTKPWATPEYTGRQMAQRFRMMQWVQADMGDEALFASVRNTGVPILALLGDKDPIIKPTVVEHYRAVLPAAKFVLIPGGGHDLQNSTTDAFVREVRGFVSAH